MQGTNVDQLQVSVLIYFTLCQCLIPSIPTCFAASFTLCCSFLQPCHVVYTDFRPTPLQHYMYPAGADGLYLVVDEKVSMYPTTAAGCIAGANIIGSLVVEDIQSDICMTKPHCKKDLTIKHHP